MDDREEVPSAAGTILKDDTPASREAAGGSKAPKEFEDIAPVLVTPGGLLDQAEHALRRSLKTDPHNTAVLRRLATFSRCRGNFGEASDAYRRLAELEPDDIKARYLHAVLSGQEPPAPPVPPGRWPAPFVRIEGFLSLAEHDTLLKTAHEQQDRLEPSLAGEGDGPPNPEWRSSWVLCKKLDTLLPWFLPRVKDALSGILPRLQVGPFPVGDVELEMTVHRSGGFYKVHQDTYTGKEHSRDRQVSYVYYFHRVPKRFTGGDLLLYDTDVEVGRYAAAFTRIEALDNSIVFFPSAYCHRVTTVHCETEDFGDSRFTLNGWFHPLSPIPLD
jgi:Rps23 Pro-64 3,4-dihydroxylase Tpa1-like proline 4-hydroxylase